MRTAACSSPDRQALEAASEWYARLRDDRAGADETRQWQAWLSASTLHRQAWDAVMAVSARFDAIAGQAELDALTRAGQGRRRVLRAVALLAGAGGLGALAWTQPVTRRHLADLRTDVGQTRHDTLPDGSRLWLDTASAVDLRFDTHVRRVVLIDGQAMIETQPDATAPARPFVLDLGHARLRALGTRFAVRRDGQSAPGWTCMPAPWRSSPGMPPRARSRPDSAVRSTATPSARRNRWRRAAAPGRAASWWPTPCHWRTSPPSWRAIAVACSPVRPASPTCRWSVSSRWPTPTARCARWKRRYRCGRGACCRAGSGWKAPELYRRSADAGKGVANYFVTATIFRFPFSHLAWHA
ncbi:FecR domain-containing protein [Achromobacter xylosoxidans]